MKRLTIALSFLTILGFLFVTSLTCYAQGEVYGCAKKKGGYLRIVTDPSLCKSNETSVTMNQGGTDSGGIKVYDASGQYLGYLIDLPGNDEYETPAKIFIPSLKQGIEFRKEDESMFGYNRRSYFSLLFENNNCTGKAILSEEGDYPSPYYILGNIPGQYYVSKRTELFSITARSQLSVQDGYYACISMKPYTTEGYEAAKIDLPFTLPIVMPLSFEAPSPTSKLVITPSQEVLTNPSIGQSVTYSINGGLPPYSVNTKNNDCSWLCSGGSCTSVACINVPDSFTGSTFNVTVADRPPLGGNQSVTIYVFDSAGKTAVTSLVLTTPDVPPLTIEPSTTQTISNPQIGNSISFTISGGNGIYNAYAAVYPSQCSYPCPEYVSASVSGSTATVTVIAIPETDATGWIHIADSHGSSWDVQLVLDVSQLEK